MTVGRLAWRTPTGGMLWEIWGRHKWGLLWPVLLLAANVLVVRLKGPVPADSLWAIIPIVVAGSCFVGTYLHLLTMFGYIEANAQTVKLGFPGRLLLKPVSTARLALTPMAAGGLATTIMLALWLELALVPIGLIPPLGARALLWAGSVQLSFFWWAQALAWGLPLFPAKSLILFTVAAAHLLIGVMPLMPENGLSRWAWPVMAVMLVSALPAAWMGLNLMRQGRWEGPLRISMPWSRLRTTWRPAAPQRFASAFAAQFWLEWRRQGLLMPHLCGGIALGLPGIFGFVKAVGEGSPSVEAMLNILLMIPLVFSGLLATMSARFDTLDAIGEVPIYISIRPMTNGGFVIAKLVMALASSALTWLITAVVACSWLAFLGTGTLFSKLGAATHCGSMALALGCVPILVLLVIVTWKNLVGGIWVGLTGRRWAVGLHTFLKFVFYIGLVGAVAAANLYESLRDTLVHWLPGIVIAALAMKIMVSIGAFGLGLQRNAITPGVVGWIVGGWLVCGIFVASYASLVCRLMDQTDLWIWAGLAGFLVVPLAELALAPLALAWNRHR